MSNISTFNYSVKQGVKNIYRNRLFSLASIGTITACLFMFGVFYFILHNVQFMVQKAETNVGITMFFQEGTKEEDMLKLKDEIENRPEVIAVTYKSAEEVWEEFCEKNFKGDESLIESYGEDNPLKDCASLEANLSDITKQEAFVEYAEGLKLIRQVNSLETAAKTMSSFNVLLGYASAAIIIILLSVSIFLISTTVTMGISVRKDEIEIMRLVGATDFFIRAPFIVEGIMIGLIGTILPLCILYFTYNSVISYIGDYFKSNSGGLSNLLVFIDVNSIFQTLIPISFVIGIGIGFIGSFMTVRKHLRV